MKRCSWFLLFLLSFPQGVCFLDYHLYLQEFPGHGFRGDTDEQQVPCGSDNKKSKNILLPGHSNSRNTFHTQENSG